jgi:hypothetical protein
MRNYSFSAIDKNGYQYNSLMLCYDEARGTMRSARQVRRSKIAKKETVSVLLLGKGM